LFVYLFAPLCHLIKENDLQSFRLENGIKLWQPLWEYKNPTARCFSALCKPRPVGKTPSSVPPLSPAEVVNGASTQIVRSIIRVLKFEFIFRTRRQRRKF
jgi:hypothetical protein